MLSLELTHSSIDNDARVEELVAQDPEASEPGIALTAFHPDTSSSLLDSASVSPMVAIVHPGHLCSRRHPDTAVVAQALTKALNITAVTLDPHGTHDSYSEESAGGYDFNRPVDDLYDLAQLLNPPAGIILGGHCLGGAQALAAAAKLTIAQGETTPRIAGVFTDKTMAQSEDFALLPAMLKRVAKGLPFCQQNPATGQYMVEGPWIAIAPERVEDYMRLGMLATHLASMPSVPVLLGASRKDTDISYENVAKLAEQFPNTEFREVPGDHSDIRPEIARSTGLIVAAWLADSLPQHMAARA